MALAGELRHQADERELAFAGDAEIELEHADCRLDRGDFEQLDAWVVMIASSSASSIASRENHSQGAPTLRNKAR